MRPNEERSKRAITFLWIFTGVTVLSIFAHFKQYFFLEGIEKGTITLFEYNSNLLFQSIIVLVNLVIYLLAGIFFIQWFRRAYYNLHLIHSNLSFTEGWASGAWFVPIMNLGRPYKIMKELMIESEDILSKNNLLPNQKNRISIINAWWTLWIVISVLSSIISRIQAKSSDLDVLYFCTLMDVLIAIAYIPLTLVAVKMIRTYNELEEVLPQVQIVSTGSRIANDDLLDSI